MSLALDDEAVVLKFAFRKSDVDRFNGWVKEGYFPSIEAVAEKAFSLIYGAVAQAEALQASSLDEVSINVQVEVHRPSLLN